MTNTLVVICLVSIVSFCLQEWRVYKLEKELRYFTDRYLGLLSREDGK